MKWYWLDSVVNLACWDKLMNIIHIHGAWPCSMINPTDNVVPKWYHKSKASTLQIFLICIKWHGIWLYAVSSLHNVNDLTLPDSDWDSAIFCAGADRWYSWPYFQILRYYPHPVSVWNQWYIQAFCWHVLHGIIPKQLPRRI